MKKQGANSAQLNNFHIQLFSLEEQENTIKPKHFQNSSSLLNRIHPLPISISPTAAVAYFAILLLWLLLLFDSYSFAYSNTFNSGTIPLIRSFSSSFFGKPFIGYTINGFLFVVIVVSILFREYQGKKGIVFLLWYLANYIQESIRYLIQIVLLFSSYFAYTLQNDLLSIFLFVLAALLACFYTVFLQNITLRKDEFCCKSMEYSCLFRVGLIVSLSVCIIMGAQVGTGGELAGCVVGHLLISSILMGCYFSFGMTIYRQPVGRFSLFGLVTLYFCLSISFIFDLLATSYYSYTSSNNPLICLAVVCVGEFFFVSFLDRLRRISNHPNCHDLRRKIFFSFNKFQLADEDEEVDCFIRGVMHQHYMDGCKNLQCIVNLSECYDSKKKKKCSITKIAQGKVSVIKFYVKCLYQSALAINPEDIHLQLDYLQFFYLKLKNVFTVMTRMARLQYRYLSFYQKMRLTRIKEYLTQESNDFSRDLYNSSLSMEHVIRSQETFSRIQQLIEIHLSRNELFWRYLSFNQVHLKEILKIVQPNFTLLQEISNEWNSISHYFPVNRRWKFCHICFTIFIKNEKVKPAMLQDFGNSVQYDSIFKTENYFVDKTSEKEQLYNSIMLFQQNTCFLHAKCDEEKMIITRASNFFHRNFDYDQHEIVGCNLNQIMPPSIQAFHHSMFLTWAKEGRSSNETCYKIRKIYPITKRGYLYPCFKFYKRYIQLGGDIEFVAMLKSNKQDQQFMLINSSFEIEGITMSLHNKLKLRTGDYLYLKGINVLAFIPMLAKYTHLNSCIKEYDEDFIQNDDNHGYYKRQSTAFQSQNDHPNIIHDRRLLNLINTRLFLPKDLQATLEQYNNLLHVRKLQPFDAVRELYSWIRKGKDFMKFKAEICIREREIQRQIYYEIEINQMEENNRLENLRMAEQGSESEGSNRQLNDNRLTDIDMQLFFSMNKKKNKVTLFPSKNIFLKDQNNRALLQIPHITNITFFFRLALIIFLSLVLTELFIQLALADNFIVLTNQYYQISRYQKLGWMLNTQYNVQHLQPNNSNSWEESFFIITYTHYLIDIFASPYFQQLIFDHHLNRPGMYQPYYPILPTNLTSRSQPAYDEFAIFLEYYQNAISLHRQAEVSPHSNLQNINYYEFNNYILAIRNKTEEIKAMVRQDYQATYLFLRSIGVVFGTVILTIVAGCLLFSLTRLWKISNGFKELVSILIQIDNSDLREICKYVDYTRYLFQHLKEKNTKMNLQSNTHSSTTSNLHSFEKKSSELTQEQVRLATSSANLNKRFKNINIGDEITKMLMRPGITLFGTIILIGGIVVILTTYAIISLDSFATFSKLGFTFMENNSVNNLLASSTIQKYRGSVLYNYSKYESFLNQSENIQSSNENLNLAVGTTAFQQNLYMLFYDNFCQLMKGTINASIEKAYDDTCNPTKAVWCSHFHISDEIMANRCNIIQSGQMTKGAGNYNNYFLKQVVPYFKDMSNLTLQDIVEINDAFKIIDIIVLAVMQQWKENSQSIATTRKDNIAIIVACVFLSTILLSILLIEVFVQGNLKQAYEVYRLIHQHYIPQWIIVKEKIIKVKLIKEGFIKE